MAKSNKIMTLWSSQLQLGSFGVRNQTSILMCRNFKLQQLKETEPGFMGYNVRLMKVQGNNNMRLLTTMVFQGLSLSL